jgi:integrase
VDLEARAVHVRYSLTELSNGSHAFGPPKSEAGRRQVLIPDVIVAELRDHLAQYAQPEPDGFVFTSPEGMPLRQSNFRRRVWSPALAAAGLYGVHFHDLRHTGNTLSADAGANMRELMERMGHSSTRAAMIYLHSTGERQRKIADTLGDLARAELAKGGSPGAAARHLAQIWHGGAVPPRAGLAGRPRDRRLTCEGGF